MLLQAADALARKDTERIFRDPVSADVVCQRCGFVVTQQAPDYLEVITCPMDLSTIRARADSGYYASFAPFVQDFQTMCRNAMTYNPAYAAFLVAV